MLSINEVRQAQETAVAMGVRIIPIEQDDNKFSVGVVANKKGTANKQYRSLKLLLSAITTVALKLSK
jgi:hypothetical protein